MMADRDRIERIIKSSVGQIVAMEYKDHAWLCQVIIPKNIPGRMTFLKRTFADLEVLQQEGTSFYVRIPTKGAKESAQEVVATRPTNWQPPVKPQKVEIEHQPLVTQRILSLEDQLYRLGKFYSNVFHTEIRAQMIDPSRARITFEQEFTYPFRHPFLDILPALLPSLVPIGIYTEEIGRKSRTALYLGEPGQRPRVEHNGLYIFIDGAYRAGIGCYGVRYQAPNEPEAYLAGALNTRDSNGAELGGMLSALAHLNDDVQDVHIYTDSTYVVHWLDTRGKAWLEQAGLRHGTVRVHHIGRDDNVAHVLANNLIRRLFS